MQKKRSTWLSKKSQSGKAIEMSNQYDNSGTLWPTKEGAKCDYSGDATINGEKFKLFGNRDGANRSVDFVPEDGEGQVVCILSPIENRKNDKMPHYRGDLKLRGETLEVAGWAKTVQTRYGEKKVLSMRISPKQSREQRQESQATNGGNNEEIPF